MARVSFTSENKRSQYADFPRLKLGRNEKARIVCLEEPEVGYRHVLRKPRIEHGVPQYTVRERRGEEVEELDKDWIGQPLCLGNEEVLDSLGVDPQNCPACKMSREPGRMVDLPQRRFSMHVIQYATKPGTSTISSPYQIKVVVWTFGDKVFNTLTDIAEENGSLVTGDYDLLLGPCEKDPIFQEFPIIPARAAEWKASDDRRKMTEEAFRENRAENLITPFMGRRVDAKFIQEDLDMIESAYRVVRAYEERQNGKDEPGLDQGLAQIAAGLEDPWESGNGSANAPGNGAAALDEAKASSAKAKERASGDTPSFDSILDEIE